MSTQGDNRVTVDRLGDHLWAIDVHGEHDMGTAQLLQTALQDVFNAGSRVIVDLSCASFIDSTVLSNLVAARARAMESAGDWLAVVAPYGSFAENLLRVSGLTGTLRVFPDRRSALAAVAASG
jgi:anti-anti-sigma factor